MSSDSLCLDQFGFTWGPMRVVRLMSVPRGRVLSVAGSVGGPEVEIWVSEKGRSLRVFKGGRELT